MGGDFEFTVPYTANYRITLAGAQGSDYKSGSGGYGWILVKDSAMLNYGDVVNIHVPAKSSSYATTSVVGGQQAVVKVNGTVVLQAGGGSGTVSNNIADNGATSITASGGEGASNGQNRTYSIHWHSGNGLSGANHANQFPTLYGVNIPGGCYVGSHVHDSYGYTCPKRICGGHMDVIYSGPGDGPGGYDWHVSCDRCGAIGYRHWQNDYTGDPYNNSRDYCTNQQYICGNMPYNVWNLGCGYQQGEILGINNDNANAGTCYWTSAFTPTQQSSNNAGGAMFKIELVECNGLQYNNVAARGLYYKSTLSNLVIRDNRVCYFKRP